MIKNLDTETVLQLLDESPIEAGVYTPSAQFLNGMSLAVLANETPVLLLGEANDLETIEIKNRLLSSNDFAQMIYFFFGRSAKISVKVVNNADFPKPMKCLIEGQQNNFETGYGGKGIIVAMVPFDNEAFLLMMRIKNEIVKCFYPNAKDLSKLVQFKCEENWL